jgi:hypothetical protein
MNQLSAEQQQQLAIMSWKVFSAWTKFQNRTVAGLSQEEGIEVHNAVHAGKLGRYLYKDSFLFFIGKCLMEEFDDLGAGDWRGIWGHLCRLDAQIEEYEIEADGSIDQTELFLKIVTGVARQVDDLLATLISHDYCLVSIGADQAERDQYNPIFNRLKAVRRLLEKPIESTNL